MRSAEIRRLLPEVFQRTVREQAPIGSLLDVMETMQAPADAILRNLDSYFNPYRTDDDFVPFLAEWVDLGRLLVEAPHERSRHLPFPSGNHHLRELVAAASYLSRWRGTAKGLIRFLETAVGIDGFAIEEEVDAKGKARPFHIVVHAPAGAQTYRSLIERIVVLEKPAYATYELEFTV